jgi:hypothetical protein
MTARASKIPHGVTLALHEKALALLPGGSDGAKLRSRTHRVLCPLGNFARPPDLMVPFGGGVGSKGRAGEGEEISG